MTSAWCAPTLFLLTLGLVNAAPAAALEKTTYYEHVAPILAANCTSCHKRAGKNTGSLVAPMSLTTYEEVRPWVRAIARKVRTRDMPPWFAEGPKGLFSNERGLTEGEIQTIVEGADAGAPGGDGST